MNERIKQLAEQVGAGTPEYLYGRTDYIVMTESELENFAALIVKECAQRVDYWESRQGEHTEDLLKHFGVGE